jgi:hypothetical protein
MGGGSSAESKQLRSMAVPARLKGGGSFAQQRDSAADVTLMRPR